MFKKLREILSFNSKYKFVRFKCPCCGYPTLDSEAGYDICALCNWEDDGQDDENADEVLGGPNGEYSLTQARENFKKYLCMYEQGKDMRITGGDTKEEIELKKKLMIAYASIEDFRDIRKYKKEYEKVFEIEKKLFDITKRRVDEYSNSCCKP